MSDPPRSNKFITKINAPTFPFDTSINLEAASKLIEISKGKVGAFIFVINLFDLGGSDKLIEKGFKVENLIEFPGH